MNETIIQNLQDGWQFILLGAIVCLCIGGVIIALHYAIRGKFPWDK